MLDIVKAQLLPLCGTVMELMYLTRDLVVSLVCDFCLNVDSIMTLPYNHSI